MPTLKVSEEEKKELLDAMCRFKGFADERGLTLTEIARNINVNPRTFYENYHLKAIASSQTFVRIARCYNLSLNWILMGIGPRELSESLSAGNSSIHQVADTYNLHFGSGSEVKYNHPDIINIHSDVKDSPGASVSQTIAGQPVSGQPGQSGNTSSASGQPASVQPSSGQASASDLQHQSASGSALHSDAEVIASLQATVRNLSDTVAQQQVTVRNLSDTVTQQAVANATLSRLIDKLNM